jgi:ATP-dependent RNA helicase RhlB
MNLPEFISVTPEEITVEGIEQSLYHVGNENKLSLLLGLREREDWERVLLFVNTKVGVEWLTRKLKGNGFPAEGITGDLPQRKRFSLMKGFKDGRIRILIATDVASRGIHIENISHVINYDLPQDAENYIHRIGRTARAGKTGRALSLACEKYVFHLEPLEEMLGYKIPLVWPEDEWLKKDKSATVPTGRKARRGMTIRARGRGTEKKKPIHRKTPAKTKRSSFPGAFFGFGPPEEDLEKAETKSAPDQSAKKKKRKRRRTKKSPAPNANSPASKAGDSEKQD